jgi:hypothetical protein
VELQGLHPEWIYEIVGFSEIKSGLDWKAEDLDFSLEIFKSPYERSIKKRINKTSGNLLIEF